MSNQTESQERRAECFEELDIESDKNPIFKSIKLTQSEAVEVINPDSIKEIESDIEQLVDNHEECIERRIAAKIVESKIELPPAKRVLWVDEAEPYYLCKGCFENHRNKAWMGEKKHPNFVEFQKRVHTKLQEGCLCEYCREAEIKQVMAIVHSQTDNTVES